MRPEAPRLHPRRLALGRLFLEERPVANAAAPALHRERPVLQVRHEHGSDLAVVLEQVALRDPVLGEEDAVTARQRHVFFGHEREYCGSPCGKIRLMATTATRYVYD